MVSGVVMVEINENKITATNQVIYNIGINVYFTSGITINTIKHVKHHIVEMLRTGDGKYDNTGQ